MADRPILFSAQMVRALLAGTKTQTRRVIKPQPTINGAGLLVYRAPKVTAQGSPKTIALCMRIGVGDRLYVRESWNWTHIADLAPGETLGRTVDECCAANGGFACACGDGIVYAATNAHDHPIHGKARWRPSVHMPRWASRITLTVTDVRVQRLQDINVEDAVAEGALAQSHVDQFATVHAVPMYRAIWNGINGPGSWDANPWVAAYTFAVKRANIDASAS